MNNKKKYWFAMTVWFCLLANIGFCAVKANALYTIDAVDASGNAITKAYENEEQYKQAITQPEVILPMEYTSDQAYNLFMARLDKGAVNISWFMRNQSATGCYVYRKNNINSNYEVIGKVVNKGNISMTFKDDSILPGIKYNYKVRPYCVLKSGVVILGQDSNVISALQSFTSPVISSAKRSGKKVTLKWKKNSQSHGYEIYCSTGSAFKLKKRVSKGSTSSTVLTKMNTKKDYVIKIRAYVTYDGKRVYSPYSTTFTLYSKNNAQVLKKIKKLQKEYPSYYYWNHMGKSVNKQDSVTKVPCNHSLYGLKYCNSYECPNGILGLQCYGFAWKMSDRIFGKNAKYKKYTSYSKISLGDMARYKGHSVIIIEIHKDYVKVGECNIGNNCMILWGRKVSKSELKGATYWHRY